MFEYPEPDAAGASNLPPAAGDASLPVPPNTRLPGPAARSPNPEKVRHLLYGSRAGIDRTIKILHAQGYADPNDWSDPLPVPTAAAPSPAPPSSGGVETWMVILTRTVLLE